MSAIRFLFTGVRDMSGPHRDGVALEDIALLDHAGRPLQIDRATNPGGRSLPYEGPDRAIDVVDMTKWLDLNFWQTDEGLCCRDEPGSELRLYAPGVNETSSHFDLLLPSTADDAASHGCAWTPRRFSARRTATGAPDEANRCTSASATPSVRASSRTPVKMKRYSGGGGGGGGGGGATIQNRP